MRRPHRLELLVNRGSLRRERGLGVHPRGLREGTREIRLFSPSLRGRHGLRADGLGLGGHLSSLPRPSPARVALLPELREFPLDVFAVVGQVLLGGVQLSLKHHARGLRLGLHRLALKLPRRRLLFEPSRGVFFVLSKPNLEMLGRLAHLRGVRFAHLVHPRRHAFDLGLTPLVLAGLRVPSRGYLARGFLTRGFHSLLHDALFDREPLRHLGLLAGSLLDGALEPRSQLRLFEFKLLVRLGPFRLGLLRGGPERSLQLVDSKVEKLSLLEPLRRRLRDSLARLGPDALGAPDHLRALIVHLFLHRPQRVLVLGDERVYGSLPAIRDVVGARLATHRAVPRAPVLAPNLRA